MNEMIPHEQGSLPANHPQQMFGRGGLPATANAGSVEIESQRAIAEAQGQLILAKKFPRDENKSYDQLMKACSVKAFAEVAFYSVPNRGSGPSIRFAEEVARVYGNFQYGHRELSRGDGKSEVEVYAWDMENNNYSKRQITVLHVMDTRSGSRKLTDQADIDNKIANVASKQIRGRILALMPKWMVADAIERCKATLAGATDEPIESRVRKMTQAFGKFGITIEVLEKHLGHKLDTTTIDELVELTGIFNALRDGAKPSEFFDNKEEKAEASVASENALAAAATAGAAAAPKKRAPAASAAPASAPAAAAQPQESKENEKPSNPVKETAPAASEAVPAQQGESSAPAAADGGDGNDLF